MPGERIFEKRGLRLQHSRGGEDREKGEQAADLEEIVQGSKF